MIETKQRAVYPSSLVAYKRINDPTIRVTEEVITVQIDVTDPQDLLAVVTLAGLVLQGGREAWKWLKNRTKRPPSDEESDE